MYPVARRLPDFEIDTPADFSDQSSERNNTPPYPPDDAALHHVFDGGWMWVLRFSNGVTSAGIAVEEWLAQELNLSEGEAAWTRFLQPFPLHWGAVRRRPPDAPVHLCPPHRVPRRRRRQEDGWALLPSAAAFVDPLFSTGMPLTLLGIERLGRILEEAWGTDALNARLTEYGQITLEEADWTAQFIGTCYAGMKTFALFREFSMFYFAAASYSEMARRLEQSHLVRRFLAADRADFASGLTHCASSLARNRRAERHRQQVRCFAPQVAESIAPLNIAGLCDPRKQQLVWRGLWETWFGEQPNCK